MTWMLSIICNSVFSIVNLIIIVITGTRRFSNIGTICAMSKAPIHYNLEVGAGVFSRLTQVGAGVYKALDERWTYENDGQLIMGVWIVQIILLPVIGMLGAFTFSKIRQDQGGYFFTSEISLDK